MNVGVGYDVHRLVAGRPLVVGGVRIEHEMGLEGHSDADVLVHAVADAVLGACRLGDVGEHFPPGEAAYAGADSIELLRHAVRLSREAGFAVEDVDCVVAAEAPKMSPYRDAMRLRLADALGVGVERVGVKATTTEGLGFEGRREGISALAVALMRKETP